MNRQQRDLEDRAMAADFADAEELASATRTLLAHQEIVELLTFRLLEAEERIESPTRIVALHQTYLENLDKS